MHFIHHQYSCGGGSGRKSMENRAQFDVFGPKHARVRFSADHANLKKAGSIHIGGISLGKGNESVKYSVYSATILSFAKVVI